MSRLTLAAVAAACLAVPAQAHVSLEKPDASAGQSYKAVLRIGHGCDGAPTTSVSVEIPDGVVAARPMPKAGWALTTQDGPYAAPLTLHGRQLTSGVRRISWSGGALPDGQYEEFTFASQIAPGVSGPVFFPVTQTCEKGEHRWVEIPKAGQTSRDLKAPAPVLRVAAGETKAAEQGALRVEQPWSRATPGGASIGAGYLRITNTGPTPDRLLGGATEIASRIETHDMRMEDGVMKMRHLPQGIEIAPGATLELKPGALHLMFVGLKQGLKQGASFSAVLQFEKAGDVPVTFSVQGMGAASPGKPAPDTDHSGHMHHMHGK